MARIALALGLASVVTAGACHWVYGYRAPGADGPFSADGDGRRAGDGVDREPACADTPVVPAPLAACATPCPGAGDCDGLPAARDYYGARCNRLLYEETFGPPIAARWQTFGGTWAQSCGRLEQRGTGQTFSNDPSTMAWARALPAESQLPTPSYLVEARVTLGPIGNSSAWGVGILARYTHPFPYLLCELRVDRKLGAAPGPVNDPDVRIELRRSAADFSAGNIPAGGWTAAWPTDRLFSVAGDAGQSYYLQLWYMADLQGACAAPPCPVVACRVCTGTQCPRSTIYGLYSDLSHQVFVPTAAGSVGVRTYGRAASFDYLRAFELGGP